MYGDKSGWLNDWYRQMNRYTKMFIVIGTSENVPNRINIIVYPNGNLKRQKLLKSFFWEV